jgi:hypothetical protein
MADESNFQFLQQEWPALFDSAQRTESAVNPDARTACFYARRALESGCLDVPERSLPEDAV